MALDTCQGHPVCYCLHSGTIIISRLAAGVKVDKLHRDIPGVPIIVTQGKFLELSTDKTSAYYVPLAFYSKAINALYVYVDNIETTATLVAIQIMVAKWHMESETAFFAHRTKWTKALQHFQFTPIFLRIVEDERGRKDVEEKMTEIKNRRVTSWPAYAVHQVSIEQIDEELVNKLAVIHPNNWAKITL